MTEPKDWLQRARNSQKEFLPSAVSKITRDSIIRAADVYKHISDYESTQQYKNQLQRADEIINAALPHQKEYIFDLLKSEKENTYYRLTLAQFLVGLDDTVLVKRAAEEVANDNFLHYPNQLFRLTYSIAQNNPGVARPFLLQMLKQSEGSIFLPQHSLSFNWMNMLMQAFGVAESFYLPELKKWSNDSNAVISSNASLLLVLFGEPDVIPILTRKISYENNSAVRDSITQLIAMMMLPQSVAALKTLKQEAVSRGLSDTLESRLLAEAVPPEPLDPAMLVDAVRIDNSVMKTIFLNNLIFTCGSDVSYMSKTIMLSVSQSDIPILRQIRSSIMRRMSDEAIYDYQTISSVINWLQWQK